MFNLKVWLPAVSSLFLVGCSSLKYDGSGTVHNERELVGIDGKLVRPDRVVFRPDGVDLKCQSGALECRIAVQRLLGLGLF